MAGLRKPSPHRRWLLALCVLLGLAVWVVFGQTVRHGFLNFDDDVNVYENVNVTRGLHWDGIVWAFTQSHAANWHPMTSISHMLDCQLFGLKAGGHHLVNVILHTATVILLFLVMHSMSGALWRSAFVAAVFAIHPLRVESVAWVTERKDVLSGLFFVLTLAAYVRYARRPFSVGRYLLVLLPFILGLSSKAMLVTLPFVLGLLDFWPLRRIGPDARPPTPEPRLVRRLIVEKIPFILLSASSCATAVWAAKHSIEPAQTLSLFWRMANALVSYTTYLGQMFYPAGLVVLYPHPGNQLPMWKVGVSLLVLSAISAAIVAGWRKRPYLLVGWLWYLGMLVPVIGLVQVGNQARADRFTYLPQIGLYLMLAWGAVDLCGSSRYRRVALGSTFGAILVGLTIVAYLQTTYWRDNVLLWSRTLRVTSRNFIAHNNLGNALADKGQSREAVSHYEQAIQLRPGDAEAYSNLGNRLAQEGKLDEAVRQYEQALQRNPDYAKAHYNLGVTLFLQERLDDAVRHYQRAIGLNPDYVDARNNLGNAYIRQGKFQEAARQYERVLQLKPDFAQAHYNWGNALARQGNFNDAIRHYEQAIKLKPDYGEGYFNLGHALTAQGKSEAAIQYFQQALRLATAVTNPALMNAARARLESYSPPRQTP